VRREREAALRGTRASSGQHAGCVRARSRGGWRRILDGASEDRLGKGGGVKVLLVDDHEDMLGMMQVMMERRAYCVATALSGEEALQVARGFEPHVIISDIGMPGMDGYEMMSTLRATDGLAPFKSIALSGYDGEDEATRAQAAGYDAQMTKPVNFDSLFQTIESFKSQT
jgi:two-component system CheB/CheR fusion protein